MNGFAIVPKKLLENVSVKSALVLSDLVGYSKKYRVVTLTDEQLANNVPFSKRTVQRCIDELIAGGFIKRTTTPGARVIEVLKKGREPFEKAVKVNWKKTKGEKPVDSDIDWFKEYLKEKGDA